MGKRELLIIALFGAAGIAVWQLLAPPDTPRRSGSPLSNLIDRARSGGRDTRAMASLSRQGSVAWADGLTTLRISGVTAVVVLGEDRADIGYQLTVEANGPDEAAARAIAERVELTSDEVGPILSLSVDAPRGARLAGALTLQVPAATAVTIDGARSTDIDGVAAVTLHRVVGDVRVHDVAGDLSGSHRNGDLAIDGAARVTLSLIQTSARITGVRDRIRLVARDGETHLENNPARIEIDGTGHAARVHRPDGSIRITGTGGEIEIVDPRADVQIDVERTPVTMTIARDVPIAVFASERDVRLSVAPDMPVNLDLRTSEQGTIDAIAFGVSPEIGADGASLRFERGDAASIAIRNRDGAIEIAQMKW